MEFGLNISKLTFCRMFACMTCDICCDCSALFRAPAPGCRTYPAFTQKLHYTKQRFGTDDSGELNVKS